jgi:hypothetical protein
MFQVVFIYERKPTASKTVGQIKPLLTKDQLLAVFVPLDTRVPKMLIPVPQIPKEFRERPDDFKTFLFVAELVSDWVSRLF